MLKKWIFLLLAVSVIPLTLPAQSATGEPTSSTARESGNTHSQLSTEEREISIVAWKFARAVMSGDFDTMRNLMVPDAEIDYSMTNIFDSGLEFMILSGIRPTMKGRYVDSGADFGTVEVRYQSHEIDMDYYLYLVMLMKQTEDGWRVIEYYYDA